MAMTAENDVKDAELGFWYSHCEVQQLARDCNALRSQRETEIPTEEAVDAVEQIFEFRGRVRKQMLADCSAMSALGIGRYTLGEVTELSAHEAICRFVDKLRTRIRHVLSTDRFDPAAVTRKWSAIRRLPELHRLDIDLDDVRLRLKEEYLAAVERRNQRRCFSSGPAASEQHPEALHPASDDEGAANEAGEFPPEGSRQQPDGCRACNNEYLVSAKQVAKLLHLQVNSLKRYRVEWPDPVVPHSGRQSAHYDWRELRPVLIRQFPYQYSKEAFPKEPSELPKPN